jgi:ureidoglycolate lyase
MVLGRQTRDGLPDFSALHAFVFDDSSGIALHPGTWHAFPLAAENDTRLTVVLRREAHLDLLTERANEMDARGPDLERHTISHLAEIVVEAALQAQVE